MKVKSLIFKIKKWIRNDRIRFQYCHEDFMYDMGYGWFLCRPSDIAIMKADSVWEEYLEKEIGQLNQLMAHYSMKLEIDYNKSINLSNNDRL